MAIAKVDELAKYLDIGQVTATRVDPGILTPILAETFDFVERYTGRKFTPEPESDDDDPVTKTFKVRKCRYIRVPDLREVASMTLNSATLTEGIDYDLGDFSDIEPATHVKLVYSSPYGAGSGFTTTSLAYSTLSVEGRWGFATVPDLVKGIVLKLAARRYRERDAMWSDAVQTPEGSVFNYFASMPEAEKLNLYRVPRIGLIY